MAEYLIQDTTLDAIADAINAKTGGSSAMTPAEMVTEIGNIPSGTTITDGVVWKTLDANGNPTEVDFYGTVVPAYCFGFNSFGNPNNPMNYVQKINWKTAITTIKGSAFSISKLRSLTIPESVTQVTFSAANFATKSTSLVEVDWLSGFKLDYNAFNNCTALERFFAPNLSEIKNASGGNQYAAFYNCTALQSAQFGSVGHTMTTIHATTFSNCTQSDLTITVYTDGSHVDSLLANTRNGATNATIIIKASEATTYNGTSYAAGDTILTSEVT